MEIHISWVGISVLITLTGVAVMLLGLFLKEKADKLYQPKNEISKEAYEMFMSKEICSEKDKYFQAAINSIKEDVKESKESNNVTRKTVIEIENMITQMFMKGSKC